MKKVSLWVAIGFCLSLFYGNAKGQQATANTTKYLVQNYSLGNLLVAVRIPGNWDAGPIIIGKISDAGALHFEWPSAIPEKLEGAADQLNFVLRTGNCDPGEEGKLDNEKGKYVLFDRIWLVDPVSKEVKGQLMAASNDSLLSWMRRPDETKTATGSYAYLLYAFDNNTLRSTCQFESWITPEGQQEEITLEHIFDNHLSVKKGFQFVQYENLAVHPYEGIQPKKQYIIALPVLPETTYWSVKE